MNKSLPSFSDAAKQIKAGAIYEHYKGMRYEVLGVSRHSETLEELLVYKSLYGDGDIWVRPLAMFLEEIIIDGKAQKRFKKIETEYTSPSLSRKLL